MFLLNCVKPEEATGKIAEIYGTFPKAVGVPEPLQLMSATPGLLEIQVNVIKYFMGHPNLTFPLLASIRYLSAVHFNYDYCIGFNGKILQAAGATDADLEAMKKDPMNAPLEDKEKSMLAFVIKALKDPKSVEKADIDTLRDLGWTDSDIFDALAHGANMSAAGIIYNAFAR